MTVLLCGVQRSAEAGVFSAAQRRACHGRDGAEDGPVLGRRPEPVGHGPARAEGAGVECRHHGEAVRSRSRHVLSVASDPSMCGGCPVREAWR